MNYYFSRKIEGNLDQIIEKIAEGLKEEGFGILSDINIKDLFKQKINVEFRPYRILGACNPVFSNKAITAEDRAGLMLPCNFVVQEMGDGLVDVSVVDPVASMTAIDNTTLKDIASQIREKLIFIVDEL
ncbi:MAG: hypothetical protein DRI73_08915 [Bacteroidetes bacterium]|nr:MAG: hypothetical protein DRI73_08915 [Bacteroidota bacterium]